MSEQLKFQHTHQPITDETEDRFEYVHYASFLANSIASIESPDGFVVALNGPWGSGKSTLLGFLRNKLEQQQVICSEFRPWMTSGRGQIVKQLLGVIIETLGGISSSNTMEILQSAQKIYKQFVTLSSPVLNIAMPGVGNVLSSTSNLDVASVFDTTIEAERDRLHKLLRDERSKVVILIDDIDRLSSSEIKDLFGAIKSLLDLPNLIYVLAYDVDIVERALTEERVMQGRDYLEKIIQAPFEIPYPDSHTLGHLLISRLQKVYGKTDAVEIFKRNDFWFFYGDCLADLLKTPRNVIRLTNVLKLTYAGLKDDVDPVDFLMIETLRLFYPSAYNLVRFNPFLFIGRAGVSDHRLYQAKFKESLKSLCPELSDNPNEWIQCHDCIELTILKRLFPKILWLLGNSSNEIKPDLEEFKAKRIYSVERFWRYFGVEDKTRFFNEAEIQSLIESCSDRDSIKSRLSELSSQSSARKYTRAYMFLEQLCLTRLSLLNGAYAANLLEAIFSIGDSIWQEDWSLAVMDKMLSRNRTELSVSELKYKRSSHSGPAPIVLQLLECISQDQKIEVVFRCLEKSSSSSVWLVISFVRAIEKSVLSQSSNDNMDIYFNSLGEFRRLALCAIRASAKSGMLLETPALFPIVEEWAKWTSCNQEICEWVESCTTDSEKLVSIVSMIFAFDFDDFLDMQKPNYPSGALEKIQNHILWKFVSPVVLSARIKELVDLETIVELRRPLFFYLINSGGKFSDASTFWPMPDDEDRNYGLSPCG